MPEKKIKNRAIYEEEPEFWLLKMLSYIDSLYFLYYALIFYVFQLYLLIQEVFFLPVLPFVLQTIARA